MSISYNPGVVTNGLILCLDAASPRSYPGTGTLWADVSGTRNDGTLINGPSYSTSNKGSITFANNYAATSAVNQAPANSNLQTFSGWLVGNGALFGSNASGTGQFHLRASLQDTLLTFRVTYFGGAPGEADDTATVTPLSVNNIVLVKTAPYLYNVYFNGVKVMNQVTKQATVNTYFYPGVYYSFTSWNVGTVTNYMIYNRALTDTEILQNYNALRGRYGI